MTESEFTLKANPPRLPRAALDRARLSAEWERVRDRCAILVVAPAGFGKTTLLLQWRRRWMADGALVAWLDADDRDEPERFTMALQHSLRAAAGRPLDPAAQCTTVPGVEALTGLLSEIATRGAPTVLFVDDAEQLPEASVRSVLQYVLMNAPANLHVVIGARVKLPLQLAELAAKGHVASLSTQDLRFRLEESMELLELRRGARLGVDDRARLHEATEGWPIGLQLAISAIEQSPDPVAAVRDLSSRHGTLQDYFVETLVSRMPEGMPAFLARVSILDPLDEDLCIAVTGEARAGEMLAWLVRETPMATVGERDDCVRLHPMARDFLLGRFEQLHADERNALHGRAAQWFAGHERWHEAANHALAAGDVASAEKWAANSLWELSTRGQLSEAREWMERLPLEMLEGDPQLRLVAASILAFSDRNAESQAFARTVLDDPSTDAHTLAVALRIEAGAAAFADQLDTLPSLLPRWPLPSEPGVATLYTVSRLNVLALLALHAGDTAQARALLAQAAVHGDAGSLRLAAGLGQMLLGLSHLWDGDAGRAEQALQPALLRAEREEGRRSLRACLLAAVLAEAMVQGDRIDAARALLANRVDVLERSGLPDTLACAYRSLACIALQEGDERRALSVLDDQCALAERRALPRLRMLALAEQVRIHAMHGRAETIAQLVDALDAMAPVFATAPMQWCEAQYQLCVAIAKSHAALVRHDVDEADNQLAVADALAQALRRGRDIQTTKMLRAVVAHQSDSREAGTLMAEALSLARLSGNERLMAEAPATAADMLEQARRVVQGPTMRLVPGVASRVQSAAATARRARADVPRSGLLTAKEAEIMHLLQKGMSNKQIARILDVSGETVKWHLKNLFLKLSAGTRKHAVDRARLLGIVE